jgi:hypothetical protein
MKSRCELLSTTNLTLKSRYSSFRRIQIGQIAFFHVVLGSGRTFKTFNFLSSMASTWLLLQRLVIFVLYYNIKFFCNIRSIVHNVFLKFRSWWKTPTLYKMSWTSSVHSKLSIVWELDFVKIVRMSKILNKKDCNLSTKSLYYESLSHACQIWISYDRPTPDLDGSMHHSEKYKVNFLSPFQEVISVLEIYLWSLLMFIFLLLYSNLRRRWSLCSMSNLPRFHEYCPSFGPGFPHVGDGSCWMGELQHFQQD